MPWVDVMSMKHERARREKVCVGRWMRGEEDGHMRFARSLWTLFKLAPF